MNSGVKSVMCVPGATARLGDFISTFIACACTEMSTFGISQKIASPPPFLLRSGSLLQNLASRGVSIKEPFEKVLRVIEGAGLGF